jgi:hypothetical protein
VSDLVGEALEHATLVRRPDILQSKVEMAKWTVPDGLARSTTHLIVSGRARHDSRGVLGPLPRPVVPARPDTIIFFYFTKHSVYIYYIRYLQQTC